MPSEKEIELNEFIKGFIQVVKERTYDFNKIIEVTDYESMEEIANNIERDRSLLDNFFSKELPKFQKDDKILFLTWMLLDIFYFSEDLITEEFRPFFEELEVKEIVSALGLSFQHTYQNWDIRNFDIAINREIILKLGSYGVEILLELINYDFQFELKSAKITDLISILKNYKTPYKQEITGKLCSFFKEYRPVVPLLAQQGYLNCLNRDELEMFTQNISKVINHDSFDGFGLSVSLLSILETRLKKLNIMNRNTNLESFKKAIWIIINQGGECDLMLILINFLEYIELPAFLDYLKETLSSIKDPLRKFVEGYTDKHLLEKFIDVFVLIYIKCESYDERVNFIKKYYKFFLEVYQLMPTNLKTRTKDLLLTSFNPDYFYDWRICRELQSDKILFIKDDIKEDIRNINEKNYRKLM